MKRYATGCFDELPNDYGKGRLPLPTIEIASKAKWYLQSNALPIFGIAVSIAGIVAL